MPVPVPVPVHVLLSCKGGRPTGLRASPPSAPRMAHVHGGGHSEALTLKKEHRHRTLASTFCVYVATLRYGAAMGREQRGKGMQVMLGPGVNLVSAWPVGSTQLPLRPFFTLCLPACLPACLRACLRASFSGVLNRDRRALPKKMDRCHRLPQNHACSVRLPSALPSLRPSLCLSSGAGQCTTA